MRLTQSTVIKSIKSLAPLLDRVLVQRVKAESKTAGGIFLPDSAVKELNEAKVLAVGPGAMDKKGNRIPLGVKAGDKVLIPQVGRKRSAMKAQWVDNVAPVRRQSTQGGRRGVFHLPGSRVCSTAPVSRPGYSLICSQAVGKDQRVELQQQYPCTNMSSGT
jgi:chaperonin GroES